MLGLVLASLLSLSPTVQEEFNNNEVTNCERLVQEVKTPKHLGFEERVELHEGLCKQFNETKRDIQDRSGKANVSEAPSTATREDGQREEAKQEKVSSVKAEAKRVYLGKFNTSHYTARCTGCTGITASGYNVRNTIYTREGYRIVAADTRVVPMGTIIKVTYGNGKSFKAKVLDKGGSIKGRKLDILVATKQEAYRLGRVTTKVEIVRR